MEPVPLISVVMPVSNGERYLSESIESILNQTFSDFEFLVLDDCSSDTSTSIVRSYSDSRIRLIESPIKVGLVPLLNRGLSLARGEFIARMDADDISRSDRFEKQVAYLQANQDVAVVGAWWQEFGDRFDVFKHPENHNEIMTRLLLLGSAIGHPAAMIRKSFLTKYHLAYDEEYFLAEDYFLWCEVSKYGILHNLPEVLLDYRVHGLSVSGAMKSKQDEMVNRVRREMLDRFIAENNTIRTSSRDLLFDFLFVNKFKKRYSRTELKVITEFLECVQKNENYSTIEMERIIGPRRLFILQNTRYPGFYSFMYASYWMKDRLASDRQPILKRGR